MTIRVGGNIIAGNVDNVLPDQTGQSGKFLTTDGSDVSWGTVSVPTVDQVYDSTSANAQSGVAINGAGFQTASDVTTSINAINTLTKIPMSSLTYASTISLDTNTAYTLTLTGDVTFTLPSPTANKLNQIEIQLYMASVYTIALGTSYYFGGSAPDMSKAGYYSIIYEYDNLQSQWIAGAIKKGQASA